MLGRLATTFSAAAALVLTSGTAFAANDWVEQWKAFAAETGKEGHAKWVQMISDPDAVKLANDWNEFRGNSAASLIAEANIPAELKPGLRITRANADSFPWLKDYLPAPSLARLKSDDWFRWDEIVIVPTNNYYMARPRLDATKEAIEQKLGFTINEKGELLAADGSFALTSPKTAAAMPFPNPTNGMELNWLNVANAVASENLHFRPIKFDICDSSNKIERRYEAHLWWQKFHGRKSLEPLGSVDSQEGVIEGGSIYFMRPRDIRGLAGVRLRYAALDRDDDFKVFIPSLRRTRILSGSDAQDPMVAGTEVTWDEWRGYWQKTDPKNFSYTMVGDGFILVQPEVGHAYNPLETDDSDCNAKSVEMELRPVWILDIDDKTNKYQYSKRRIYIDKEHYILQYTEMYDQRGNLLRIWDQARDWDPKTGMTTWKNVMEWNPISNRLTILTMMADWENLVESTTPGTFDIDQLRDYR